VSINRVVISGNLTRDPELRSTPSGYTILNIGVAVNDRRRNQQTNEWEDYANFVDCVVFGNRAEYLSRALRKGSKVVIEGKLRYSSWENKDGQRRSKIEIMVDDIDFMSPRQQSGNYSQGSFDNQAAPTFSAPQPVPAVPAPSSTVAAPPKQEDVYDEDIPF
jgi:single-strand DNA-binding protein